MMFFIFIFQELSNVPKNVVNKIGKRYGKLIVQSFAGIKNNKSLWNCKCDCGGYAIVSSTSLSTGNTISCGCAHKGREKRQIHCLCDNCGKSFSIKQSRFIRSHYHYCCKKCFNEHKKITFCGSHNHQYGLRGILNKSFKQGERVKQNNHLIEKLVYVGEWYKKNHTNGRIPKHRYLVEKNYHLYDSSLFEIIDQWHYLKSGIEVHHKDFNHNNNEINNLMPLTKKEHVRLHNLQRKQIRDKYGKFLKLM